MKRRFGIFNFYYQVTQAGLHACELKNRLRRELKFISHNDENFFNIFQKNEMTI